MKSQYICYSELFFESAHLKLCALSVNIFYTAVSSNNFVYEMSATNIFFLSYSSTETLLLIAITRL